MNPTHMMSEEISGFYRRLLAGDASYDMNLDKFCKCRDKGNLTFRSNKHGNQKIAAVLSISGCMVTENAVNLLCNNTFVKSGAYGRGDLLLQQSLEQRGAEPKLDGFSSVGMANTISFIGHSCVSAHRLVMNGRDLPATIHISRKLNNRARATQNELIADLAKITDDLFDSEMLSAAARDKATKTELEIQTRAASLHQLEYACEWVDHFMQVSLHLFGLNWKYWCKIVETLGDDRLTESDRYGYANAAMNCVIERLKQLSEDDKHPFEPFTMMREHMQLVRYHKAPLRLHTFFRLYAKYAGYLGADFNLTVPEYRDSVSEETFERAIKLVTSNFDSSLVLSLEAQEILSSDNVRLANELKYQGIVEQRSDKGAQKKWMTQVLDVAAKLMKKNRKITASNCWSNRSASFKRDTVAYSDDQGIDTIEGMLQTLLHFGHMEIDGDKYAFCDGYPSKSDRKEWIKAIYA